MLVVLSLIELTIVHWYFTMQLSYITCVCVTRGSVDDPLCLFIPWPCEHVINSTKESILFLPPLFIHLSVCLSYKTLATDFDEIFRRGRAWLKERVVTFLVGIWITIWMWTWNVSGGFHLLLVNNIIVMPYHATHSNNARSAHIQQHRMSILQDLLLSYCC